MKIGILAIAAITAPVAFVVAQNTPAPGLPNIAVTKSVRCDIESRGQDGFGNTVGSNTGTEDIIPGRETDPLPVKLGEVIGTIMVNDDGSLAAIELKDTGNNIRSGAAVPETESVSELTADLTVNHLFTAMTCRLITEAKK